METTKLPTRPSRRVDLSHYEAITTRIALNQKLMAGSCAFDRPLEITFSEAELQVLKVMAVERFSVNTILRKRAIYALGKQRTAEALEDLMRLAETEHEEIAVRAEALQAIHAISPRVGRVVMEKHLTASSPDLALAIVRYLYQTETPESRQLADRFLGLRKNARIRRMWEQGQQPTGQQAPPKPDRHLNGRLH